MRDEQAQGEPLGEELVKVRLDVLDEAEVFPNLRELQIVPEEQTEILSELPHTLGDVEHRASVLVENVASQLVVLFVHESSDTLPVLVLHDLSEVVHVRCRDVLDARRIAEAERHLPQPHCTTSEADFKSLVQLQGPELGRALRQLEQVIDGPLLQCVRRHVGHRREQAAAVGQHQVSGQPPRGHRQLRHPPARPAPGPAAGRGRG
mmetsp:Transcript_37410/g.96965  ORF Transcript_37410/g.96965 Transcript_37410/m.96965 type:complete len:206 (-) Transcript_37410:82-699(-)